MVSAGGTAAGRPLLLTAALGLLALSSTGLADAPEACGAPSDLGGSFEVRDTSIGVQAWTGPCWGTAVTLDSSVRCHGARLDAGPVHVSVEEAQCSAGVWVVP